MCYIVLVEVLSRLTMRCVADVLCFVVRPASNKALAVKMALCSAVNVTSTWVEKDSPLHWTPKHAHTHARREGGRRGWKQTDRNNAFVVSSPCSKCFTFQPMGMQKYSFKIHLNFSGKQLFW